MMIGVGEPKEKEVKGNKLTAKGPKGCWKGRGRLISHSCARGDGLSPAEMVQVVGKERKGQGNTK